MATKAISIEIDAYELLAREKKDRTESFSRVIRRPHCSRAAERRRRQSVSLRLANGAPADFLATPSRRKRCVDRRDRANLRGDRGWPRARLCTNAATRIFDVLIAAYIFVGTCGGARRFRTTRHVGGGSPGEPYWNETALHVSKRRLTTKGFEAAGSEVEPGGSASNLSRSPPVRGRSGRFRGAGLKSEQSKVLLGDSGPLLRRRMQNKSAQMNRA
jgi:predicted CopG family antitoxin